MAISYYEGAIGWMTLEQLSYTLARIAPTHDFILMHLVETRFEGIEQHFYDFGLFFREFVLLVPHDGRTEPRTEDIADASFSKRRVLAAPLGQEWVIVELEPPTSQLGDIRSPAAADAGKGLFGRTSPRCWPDLQQIGSPERCHLRFDR